MGWHSAKSAPNLSKNGLVTHQTMTQKAATSYNHLCMDAIKDKQYSIGDGWLELRCHSLKCVLRMGWHSAKSEPNLSKKWTCHPPNHDTKSYYIMLSSLYGCYERQIILYGEFKWMTFWPVSTYLLLRVVRQCTNFALHSS